MERAQILLSYSIIGDQSILHRPISTLIGQWQEMVRLTGATDGPVWPVKMM
jgi:hypothetical protein